MFTSNSRVTRQTTKDRARSRSAASRRRVPPRPVTPIDPRPIDPRPTDPRPTDARPSDARPSDPRPSGPPDWTEQWKLQVEAEARRLLKKSLRGVGREK